MNWFTSTKEKMMTKHGFLTVVATATLFLTLTSTSQALDLSGTLGGLGNSLGKVTEAVGNTANGVTGNVANTATKLGALNNSGALSAEAKSDILNGVMAKARILPPQELARLCLATGGGDKGCGSGNKPRILGIIDARLEVLSNRRLISVCASVGAGCGGKNSGTRSPGSIAAVPPNAVAALLPEANANAEAPTTASNRRLSSIAAKLSNSEAIVYKKRCSSVLRNPRAYENDIVQICKLIN